MLKISQFCCKHNETFTTFCKKHEKACCRRCMQDDHKDCNDFDIIDDVIDNVKTSSAYTGIEQLLVETFSNIQTIQREREDNLESLKDKREYIENEILAVRMNLNAHLDKIQKDAVNKLFESEKREIETISQFVQSLEQSKTELRELQEILTNFESYASSLQTFVALKHIEYGVRQKITEIQSSCTKKNLCKVSMTFQLNEELRQFVSNVKNFGDVEIDCTCKPESRSTIIEHETKDAQVASCLVSSLESIKLTMCRTVTTKASSIRGCIQLNDGRLVFTCMVTGAVRIVQSNGLRDFKVKLQKFIFDVTFMEDTNSIAVTSGFDDDKNITLIDISTKKPRQVIPVDSYNFGITYVNGVLFYCAGKKGIMMLDLLKETTSQFKDVNMPPETYIASNEKYVFYTSRIKHCVECCDLQGNTKWIFKDIAFLECPVGVSVDNEGYIYVVDYHAVVVITPDGKHGRRVLSSNDGLYYPWALNVHRSNNQLMIANSDRTIFLYNVERL